MAASTSVFTMSAASNGLHPFFTASRLANGSSAKRNEPNELATDVPAGGSRGQLPHSDSKSKSPDISKCAQDLGSAKSNDSTSHPVEFGHDILQPQRALDPEVSEQDQHSTQTEDRRKRRRLDVPFDQDHVPMEEPPRHEDRHDGMRKDSPPVTELSSSKGSTARNEEVQVPQSASPDVKEVLQLSGKGTFKSPKSTRPKHEESTTLYSPMARASRGRPRKRTSLIAVLSYGKEGKEERLKTGMAIEDILNASEQKLQLAPVATQALNPSKPTHPFFSAKPRNASPGITEDSQPVQPLDTEPERSKSKSFTTPVKMRSRIAAEQSMWPGPANQPSLFMPRKTSTTGPMVDAPWPWKGFHGIDGHLLDPLIDKFMPKVSSSLRDRACKAKPEIVGFDENLIERFSSRLADRRSLEFGERTSQRAQLPTRSVMTGQELRNRVTQAISAQRHSMPITGIAENGCYSRTAEAVSTPIHPALAHIASFVGSSLSAFDRGECETRSWTQKYAPRKASHVLQSPRETAHLKQWLESLKIDAVDKAQHRPELSSRSVSKDQIHPLLKKKKKRRARPEDLDGFIVSSDDEANEMQAVEDDAVDQQSDDATAARSVFRTQDLFNQHKKHKNNNVLLLSGPHGCGKTAAAYAVAYELDFEVFELNPASRRSGKDVLDKVGDLALNHQVRQAEGDKSAGDTNLAEVETAEAGQRGLIGFFKPASAQTKTGKQKSSQNKENAKNTAQHNKGSTKKQRQAIILLEEVDLLYEDDKLFWETVIELAFKSRRPIIMTCNDESVLPIEDLSLHAILRFRAATVELATEYLLYLAASEGHLLSYKTAETIYTARGKDLRSAIAEVDFWCQMAIDNGKGGMEWYIKRWPPGSDTDAMGQMLHVVSNDTVQESCGLLAQNGASAQDASEDAVVSQAWTEWAIEPSDVSHWALSGAAVKEMTQDTHLTPSDTFAFLTAYGDCLDSRSAADTMTRCNFPSQDLDFDILDPDVPLGKAEWHRDYIRGHRVVRADLETDFSQLASQITISMHTGLRRHWKENELLFSNAAQPHESIDSLRMEVKRAILAPRSDLRSQQLSHWSLCRETFDNVIEALLPTVMTRAMNAVNAEIGPYVRSIAGFDVALEEQRQNLAAALGSGSNVRAAKRARTTRASRSALEGGQRASTRRERWFGPELDCVKALATSGPGWPRTEAEALIRQFSATTNSANSDSRHGSRASSVQSMVE